MRDGAAVDLDCAGVRAERAGNDVDQGRLAGTVLAEQSVDPAGDQLDGNVAQHGVAEEGLRYAPCRDDRRWLNHRQSAFWRYCCVRSCSNMASS